MDERVADTEPEAEEMIDSDQNCREVTVEITGRKFSEISSQNESELASSSSVLAVLSGGERIDIRRSNASSNGAKEILAASGKLSPYPAGIHRSNVRITTSKVPPHKGTQK